MSATQEKYDEVLEQLLILGEQWLDARVRQDHDSCIRIHETAKAVERESRKLERKLHKERKRAARGHSS